MGLTIRLHLSLFEQNEPHELLLSGPPALAGDAFCGIRFPPSHRFHKSLKDTPDSAFKTFGIIV